MRLIEDPPLHQRAENAKARRREEAAKGVNSLRGRFRFIEPSRSSSFQNDCAGWSALRSRRLTTCESSGLQPCLKGEDSQVVNLRLRLPIAAGSGLCTGV